MRVWVLGSGSKGNAVVIESGDCRVLIDVGFGPRILQKRLDAAGIAPESIEACIITHEHSDHIRGAARAARRWHWPLFASEGTYGNSRLVELGIPAATFAAGATLEFSEMDIATFRVPHDASEPIGVVATATNTGAKAAVLTDLGHASRTVRKMVRDVDILVLESNHDDDMLANGPYPPFLQRRIAGSVGHLSNRECGALVRDSVSTHLRHIVLAHLSEENNTPRVAYEAMKDAVRGTGFRGALIPTLQDSVVGPITASSATKRETQLALPL